MAPHTATALSNHVASRAEVRVCVCIRICVHAKCLTANTMCFLLCSKTSERENLQSFYQQTCYELINLFYQLQVSAYFTRCSASVHWLRLLKLCWLLLCLRSSYRSQLPVALCSAVLSLAFVSSGRKLLVS